MKERKSLSAILKTTVILAIFFLGAVGGYFYSQWQKPNQIATTAKKDVHLAFIAKVYKTIQENYWEKFPDEQLAVFFQLAAEKITGQPQILKSKDKAGLEKILTKILKQLESEEKKKEFVIQLAETVLVNLKPLGRNLIYTKKEEKALSDQIKNINPEVDQYEVLGVERKAGEKEIETAYKEKIKDLEPRKESSLEAKREYEKVEQAHKILSDKESRKVYDASGIEPTEDDRLLRPEIFYIHLKKFSPTTFDELKRATEKVDNHEGLDTLILDLRDNIGGSIDILPYLLGPFIGFDQYAYEFFHQGQKTAFKTKTGWLPSLVRYKKVVVLVNENTQSSAELFAATLKKYNAGILVGTPTKGWGTVENVFPLDQQIDLSEKYSIFLVHSLALRDDGQPIEENGVEPVVNINDPNWEKELFSYFHYQELTGAVKEIIKTD